MFIAKTALLLSLCSIVLQAACSNDGANSVPPSVDNEVGTAVESNAADDNDVNDVGEIRIKLTFSGGETVAVLEDIPTTQSLLEQLPVTLTFDDFGGAEKIAYLPEDLSTKDAPDGHDPEIGDVACYGPWGNLVFYYEDQTYYSGIIPMGRVESGLEKLGSMGAGFEVTIEQLE